MHETPHDLMQLLPEEPELVWAGIGFTAQVRV